MKRRYIKWILVFIWAIVIFIFSSQNGEISSQNNRFIIELFKKIGIDINTLFSVNADFIVRKMAHFTEYFIFYLLLFNALIDDFIFNKSLLISIIITFIYSVSDEFHQSFVPGRSPTYKDVLIDTAGGLVCMIFIYLWNLIRKFAVSKNNIT
ncbi:VanZ family protein [Caloramator australicus]|uniref:Acetobutylicum phosphotransbutyrylase n=1 Tax=Caloramator australicus RC3 TaxID=857293 RepID=I7K5I4_9CLOT|nr:VanZ family protein [Caloramator australicus]CCJ32809.1 acetobutylicum phosphotransbutyrylase [Caloramator australicus RC3]